MNKILKGFNVLLLSALTATVAHGKAVDENTAKLIGCNQLISANAKGVNSPADLTTAYVATSQTAFGVIVDYYVFNIQSGIGFVMISADDNIIPVLAYSTESSFDYEKMAPAAKDWVDGYKNEIAASITTKYPAQEGTAEQWSALMSATPKRSAAKTTVVAPLVKSTWDQAPGYNNYCPSGTPTGCVATSIAQVMRYWSWPTVGSGYHTYKPASYATRSADFGNKAYNWSGMPLTSNNIYVAQLMSDVGISVNMNYGTSSSGAYTTLVESPIINCSEYALRTYFHYKSTIHSALRYDINGGTGLSNIPAATWNTTLKVDLDAARPILYSGHGSSGGHAWVCDGYDATNKFHFNWGWSGSGPDGYYTVDNLNPPVLGVGGGGGNFNTAQSVIMGIQPDSFSAVTDNIKLLAHVDHQVDIPATYPVSAFSVTTKVLNSNGTAYSGDFRLDVFDANLKFLTTMQTLTGKAIASGDSLSLTFASTSAMYQLVPGLYKLRVLYRPTSASAWSLVGDNGTFINENIIAVNNNQDMELATDMSLTPAGTGFKIGAPFSVAASIKNEQTGNFNGNYRAVLTNVVTGTQTVVGAPVSDIIYYASTGGPYNFSLSSVSVTPGTYVLATQHKLLAASTYTYTGDSYHPNPVIVTFGYGLAGVNSTSLIAEKITVYPNPSNDVINIGMDGVDVSRITITDIQGRQLQELIPGAGQSSITVSVNNYASGIYFVNLFSGEEVVTKKIVVAK